MDNTQEYTCLSLCSGYGGLELGLKRTCPNVRTVAYVEVEAFACANLVAKMEQGLLDAAPIWTDIKTFNAEPFRDRIHFITAGYPCQPFSVAGQRKGTDDPRHLWPYIERIIEAVRPVWFFGENVSGHLTIGFPEVYRSLRNMGYSVEAGLFSAAECGAPHRRERLFILAKSSRATSRNINRQAERGFRQEDVRQGNRQIGSIRSRTASELGNTEHNGHIATQNKKRTKERGGNNKARQNTTSEFTRPSEQSGELADTKYNGRRKVCFEKNGQPAQQLIISKSKKRRIKWPARPGQPQYEWEEPRVVANSKSSQSRQGKPQQETGRQNEWGLAGKNRTVGTQRQTQSQLGRAVDGTAHRVDRLRLLGNGVVPQQAEKAFRYLMKKANR